MDITSIFGLIAGVIALLFSSLSGKYAKRKKEKEAQQRELYNTNIIESFARKSKDWNPYLPAENSPLSDLLRPNYERTLRNIIAHSPISSTETEVENEVKEKFGEIDIRLKEIEKKFPKESTLEKIASINDAILATNIETLSESIKRIEDKLLTKWDVAKVTFRILGGLGILLGIIISVIKLASLIGG